MPHDSLSYRWLLETQIEPTFARHPFVRWANVLLIPQRWIACPPPTTALVIFYSRLDRLDYEAAMDSLAQGVHDANLPPGLSNHDLYLPIRWGDLPSRLDAPPFEFCTRESFAGEKRDPEYGHYESLDAFAVFARFSRGPDGRVVCDHLDSNLARQIDRAL